MPKTRHGNKRKRARSSSDASPLFEEEENSIAKKSEKSSPNDQAMKSDVEPKSSSNKPKKGKQGNPDGLLTSYHGIVYQVKWMMKVALECKKHDLGSEFRFEAEVGNKAGKFDDVIWQYKDSQQKFVYNFLQAKHKKNTDKKITIKNLLQQKQNDRLTKKSDKTDKRPFALEKYFISYRDIIKNKYREGRIENLIIATNIDLDEKLKESFSIAKDISVLEDISASSDASLLYGAEGNSIIQNKKAEYWKIPKVDGCPVKEEIKQMLEGTYDLIKLARRLGECVLNNETVSLSEDTFLLYGEMLTENVIDIETRAFRSDFIEKSSSEHVNNLQEAFFQEAYVNKRKSLGLSVEYKISQPEKLAKKIAQKIISLLISKKSNKEIALNKMPEDHIDDLAGYVLIEIDQFTTNVQFNSKFWKAKDKDMPHSSIKVFREELKSRLKSCKQISQARIDALIAEGFKEYHFKILNITICKGILLDEKTFWEGVKSFNKVEGTVTPNTNIFPYDCLKSIKKEIKHFFKKLVFAVNFSKESLSKFVEQDLGEHFGLINNSYIAHAFQLKISNALDCTEKGSILNTENFSRFVDNAKKTINRLILIGPTLEYRAKIEEYGIHFRKRALNKLGLVHFLTQQSNKQIFNVITEQNELSSIKVYQVLKNIPEYVKNDSYILVNLISLLRLQDYVIQAFSTENKNLLVIDCESENHDVESLYEHLKKIKEDKPNKKIVLITKKGDALVSKFKNDFANRYQEENDEKISLIDLNRDSRKKIREKGKVIFQGEEVSLGTILRVDKKSINLINEEVLSKLIGNKKIYIGKAPTDSKYDRIKDYYIDRTFLREKITIKEDFKEEESKFFVTSNDQVTESNLQHGRDIVLISKTDMAFTKLLNKYIKHNIHWLKEETNEFIWQQSHGDLSRLRKFVDTNERNFEKYKPKNITDLTDRIVIINAEAGMGKSTVLTNLAVQTKAETDYDNLWIAKINLVDHESVFERWKKYKTEVKENEAINFLYRAINFQLFEKYGEEAKKDILNDILKLTYIDNSGEIVLKSSEEKKLSGLNLLEVKFFNYFYKHGKIALLFDGFDEIITDYKNQVIELLNFLKSTKLEKIWVNTRPCNGIEELENKLCTFPHVLKPFLNKQQMIYLKKFWQKNLGPDELDDKRIEFFTDKLTKIFIEPIQYSQVKTFTGNALHISMIAEYFESAFKELYDSQTNELPDEVEQKLRCMNLNTLYKYICRKKVKEIAFSDMTEMKNKYQNLLKKRIKEVEEDHKKLALCVMFQDDTLSELLFEQEISEIYSLIKRFKPTEEGVGFIDIIDKKPHFIHRTYAEYFAAYAIADMLKKGHEKCKSDFFYKSIIEFELHNSLLPIFFNYKLVAVTSIHAAALSGNMEKIGTFDNVNVLDIKGRTPLHLAVYSGHLDVVKYLLDKGADVTIADQMFKWTPFHYATREGLEIIKYFFEHLEVPILRQVVNARDIYQRTWLSFVAQGEMYILLKELCEKYDLNIIGVDANVQDKDGKTPLHLVIEQRGVLCVHNLLLLGANPNIQDNTGRTPLHFAAYDPVNVDIIYEHLVPTSGADPSIMDNQGKTPFHIAIENIDSLIPYLFLNILLLDKGEEDVKVIIKDIDIHKTFSTNLYCEFIHVVSFLLENTSKALNVQDNQGKTALHHAVNDDNKAIVDFLINRQANPNIIDDQGKYPLDYADDIDILKSLLKGGAFFDIASTDSEIADITDLLNSVDQLFNAVKENNLNEVKRILSTSKEHDVIVNTKTNDCGKTPLHYAAQKGYKEIVRYLLAHGAYFNVPDNNGITPLESFSKNEDKLVNRLFDAVAQGKVSEVIKLINEGVEINSADYTRKGMQPLHLAVENGNSEIVEALLEKKPMVNGITLDNSTLFHLAVQNDRLEIIEILLNRIDSSKLSELINSCDVYGEAPLHIAVRRGNLETVRKLLKQEVTDIHVLTPDNKFTPLHIAAKDGKMEITELLLTRRPELTEDNLWLTPLHYALQNKHIEIAVRILKQQTTDFQTDFRYKGMPLSHFGAKEGYDEIVLVFFDDDIMPHLGIDFYGNTLLHYAAQNGNVDMIKSIIELGYFYGINIKNKCGKTPLDLAQEKFARNPENGDFKMIIVILSEMERRRIEEDCEEDALSPII